MGSVFPRRGEGVVLWENGSHICDGGSRTVLLWWTNAALRISNYFLKTHSQKNPAIKNLPLDLLPYIILIPLIKEDTYVVFYRNQRNTHSDYKSSC